MWGSLCFHTIPAMKTMLTIPTAVDDRWIKIYYDERPTKWCYGTDKGWISRLYKHFIEMTNPWQHPCAHWRMQTVCRASWCPRHWYWSRGGEHSWRCGTSAQASTWFSPQRLWSVRCGCSWCGQGWTCPKPEMVQISKLRYEHWAYERSLRSIRRVARCICQRSTAPLLYYYSKTTDIKLNIIGARIVT